MARKKLQFRRDKEANWNSINPILIQGEVGYILDDVGNVTGKKIGNGASEWRVLPTIKLITEAEYYALQNLNAITVTLTSTGEINSFVAVNKVRYAFIEAGSPTGNVAIVKAIGGSEQKQMQTIYDLVTGDVLVRTKAESGLWNEWKRQGGEVADGSITESKLSAEVQTKLNEAEITSAEVTVTNTTGTPSATAEVVDGKLKLAFANIKGEKGADGKDGATGETGPQGEPGIKSVEITVDDTTGSPTANSTIDENQVLHIKLSGIKGEQGNSGYTGGADELEVVNNLTDGGAEKALSAEMGKQLRAVQNKKVKVNNGYNLILLSRATVSGYIKPDGKLDEGFTDWISYNEPVLVEGGVEYYYGTSRFAVAFYDAENSFISHYQFSTNTSGTITAPSNAFYAKFSIPTWVTEGEELYFSTNSKGYISDGVIITSTDGFPISEASIKGLSKNLASIREKLFGKDSVNTKVTYSDNLFITDDITEEGYIKPSGVLDTSFAQYGWKSSKNFVPVQGDTEYIIKRGDQLGVAMYDENFIFLSHVLNQGSFTTPANCCYIKITTTSLSSLNSIYISTLEGSTGAGEYPIIELTTTSGLPLKLQSNNSNKKSIKIATLGTSITYRGNYQTVISQYTGAEFLNYGLSGRSMKHFCFHRTDGSSGEIDRLLVASDFDAVDAIIICGYANDLWGIIGSMESEYIDISQEGADSYESLWDYADAIENNGYISAARSVIEYIIKLCPSIPIIVAGELPMSRPKEAWNGSTNNVDFKRIYDGSNASCADFNKALKTVAEYYSLPYVDMEHNGQVNILNYTQYYSDGDTTHPNFKSYDDNIEDFPNSGMKRMAILLIDGLRKVLHV